MTPILPQIRKQIDLDPFYKTCALWKQHSHLCEGRITMDHAVEFAGRQLQELWAIVPVCTMAHGVDKHTDNAINKELRLWVALNRGSDADLSRISKATNYLRERERLNSKWGVYGQKIPEAKEIIEAMSERKMWYPVPNDLKAKISICSAFHKEVLGYNSAPFEVIKTAIENYYDELKEQTAGMGDKSLYKKIGFE